MTRATASEAALKFLQDWPVDIDARLRPEDIPALRADISAEFIPRAKRAVAATGVEVIEVEIGGIPCLRVVPPAVDVGRRIFYGYGGGFFSGSPFEDLIISAPLALATRAEVIVPHYRLAPEHPFPAPIDDGFAVYAEMARSGPFCAVGESAGGNLVLSVMARARQAGLAAPEAVALMSPWCDLTSAGDSLTSNDGRDPTLTKASVDDGAGIYANGVDLGSPELSPLFGDFSAVFPPCIITSGSRDLLMSQSLALASVLRAEGNLADLRIWEGMWHVFEFYDELPEAAASLAEIAAFLSPYFRD
ncbi:MAG: alpha/beta hydrolase [Pikeienuella sp.]